MKENRERAQLFIMEREGVKITNDPTTAEVSPQPTASPSPP